MFDAERAVQLAISAYVSVGAGDEIINLLLRVKIAAARFHDSFRRQAEGR